MTAVAQVDEREASSPETPRCGSLLWYSINVALRCVGIALLLFHGPAAAEPSPLTAAPGAQTFKSAAAAHPPPQTAATSTYPPLVEEMRELITYAVRSGNIDELALALEASIHPTRILSPNRAAAPPSSPQAPPAKKPSAALPKPDAQSPIEALKAMSHDGTGRDLLARIGQILDLPAVKLPLGADYENQDVYVWPYLAERPLDQLAPAEIVDLYRIAPPDRADRWRHAKTWGGDRLLIGADGAWLAFIAAPGAATEVPAAKGLRQN